MDYLVPIAFFAALLITACAALYVGYSFIRWLSQSLRLWHYNRSRPIETFPARVVVKRTDTTGQTHGFQYSGRVDTWYYVTFEFRSGERREYHVDGADYGLVAEGDEGYLTFKGTVFHQFHREGVKG